MNNQSRIPFFPSLPRSIPPRLFACIMCISYMHYGLLGGGISPRCHCLEQRPTPIIVPVEKSVVVNCAPIRRLNPRVSRLTLP